MRLRYVGAGPYFEGAPAIIASPLAPGGIVDLDDAAGERLLGVWSTEFVVEAGSEAAGLAPQVDPKPTSPSDFASLAKPTKRGK